MKNTCYIFILLVLFLVSCNQQEKKHKTVKIDNDVERRLSFEIENKIFFMKFDSAFQKERIIKLETNNNSLIGAITKVEYHHNKVYVIDSQKDYSVICFDANGKFKFKLKKIGKGPHEYISFGDANINKATGDIELLARGEKLMIYDSLGNFKQKIKLPYFASRFAVLKGIRFFYKNFTIERRDQEESFRLYSIDSEGTLKKYLKFKSNGDGVTTRGYDNFTRFNDDEYRFMEVYNDTIYRITAKNIKSLYKVDFVGYKDRRPKDFLSNRDKYPDTRKAAKKMKIPYLSSYKEFDNFIIGHYIEHIGDVEGAFRYIFDKETNKLLQSQNGIYYKSLNLSSFAFAPRFYIDDSPSAIVPAYKIDEFIENQGNPEDREKVKSYFEYDGNTGANPYIIQYKSQR